MTTTSTRKRLSGWAAVALTALLAALLSACGGGGSESKAPVSRIEVGPQGALLAGLGATRSLTAQLFDAAGTPVLGSVVWSSSDPAIVTVDTNGTLRAVAAVGTVRITAAVGALQSTAALVTVAQPTVGARLLADSQIVSGPTPVNAAAAPAAGNAYEVVLRGVPALAVGTIVIASEAANVAGRVLSVQPEGADQRVQLLSVPPNQLFTAFDFRDSVDLAQGPFEIPADLAASYDVTQTGSTFVFTPKRATPSSSGRAHIRAATGTRALPPLPPFKECEATAGFGSGLPLPLALSAPPSFQVTLDGAVVRTADASGTRIAVTASPVFNFTSVLQITSAFEAKVGCKLTMVRRNFRVPGWAGLFFGGDVEFGVGFEVGGKVTLASATVGGTAELKPTLTATLECPVNANCGLTGNMTAVTDVKPVFTTPSIEQLRFEPGVSLFAFLAIEAGNPDLDQLQFKVIEIKAGVDLTAKLTPEVLQIANADPILGRSQYSLAFKGDIGPGIKLGEFLTFAGLSEVVPLKLGFEVPLGASPTAASVVADRSRYLPGQRATVTVKLAPASVRFPSGLVYNVKTVQLRRSTGLISTELLAEQIAADGQTDFVLGFDSPGLLNAADIVAFVDTRVLAFLPLVLEIGSAASAAAAAELSITPENPRLVQGQQQQFVAFIDGQPTTDVIWSLAPGEVGTVSATGLYTAPAIVTVSGSTVTATSTLRTPTIKATQEVNLVFRESGNYTGTLIRSGCQAAQTEAATLSLTFSSRGEVIASVSSRIETRDQSFFLASFFGSGVPGGFLIPAVIQGAPRPDLLANGTADGSAATLQWRDADSPGASDPFNGCLYSFRGTKI